MMPMLALRGARNTLLTIFALFCIVGPLYAAFEKIPFGIAIPVSIAFALEASMYAACGIGSARKFIGERLRGPVLAPALTLSAALPYSIYAVPTGTFEWRAFALLMALAAAVSFWYIVFPRHWAADIAFVALIAAVVLSGAFSFIYATPFHKLPLVIFGQLMWTRVSIFAALLIARMDVKGFGFLPSRKEWKAGALNFLLFVPCGVLLNWGTGFGTFHPHPTGWWQMTGTAVLTFLGMLWVVALREEFFFRGLLQEWFEKWTRSKWAGLVIAAVAFGSVHLPFRGFPNWRFALMAALAGLFFGRAYMTTRSVRAAMIAHALVNTFWRVLFS